MDTSTILLVLGLVVGLGVLGYGWRSNTLQLALLRADARILTQTVASLSLQLGTIHQAVIPLNLAIQNVLVKELTHFHTPVLDALMLKLGPPFILTDLEEVELLRLLDERGEDMAESISSAERDAAKILPVIIRRVRHDLVHTTPGTALTLQLVSVTPFISE